MNVRKRVTHRVGVAIEEEKLAINNQIDGTKRSLAVLGTMLILLSGALFFLMCGLPWIYLWGMNKWMVGTVLYVLVQVAWWLGAAMVGPSAFKKIWTYVFPVRKSKEQL